MFVVSQTHAVVFEVSFHDADGDSVGSNRNVLYRDVEKNKWLGMNLFAEAPRDAAYMQIHFGSGGVSLTEAYFDDVSFSQVERTIENPSAMSNETFLVSGIPTRMLGKRKVR